VTNARPVLPPDYAPVSVNYRVLLFADETGNPELLRQVIVNEYVLTMETLPKYQKNSGMWGEQIDIAESRPESSGTGMLIYAMATGVAHGWLPEDAYRQAVKRAWRALTNCVDAQGAVTNISDFNFRREPPWKPWLSAGDMHGQCAILWAATGMLRMASPESEPVAECPD